MFVAVFMIGWHKQQECDLFDIIKNDVKFNIGFGIIFFIVFFDIFSIVYSYVKKIHYLCQPFRNNYFELN